MDRLLRLDELLGSVRSYRLDKELNGREYLEKGSPVHMSQIIQSPAAS